MDASSSQTAMSDLDIAQQLQHLLNELEFRQSTSRHGEDIAQHLRAALAILTAQDAATADSRERSLGELLRKRRERADLSLAQLAKMAGLAKNTIFNIEQGAHSPNAETLRRIWSVAELGLSPTDLTSSSGEWRPNSWVPQGYDPVQMTLNLIRIVNGPGGSVEQTYLYLDGQSAADWLSICSTESFAESYRKTRPLEAAATEIARLVRAMPLDINALGPGDGKSEVALVGQLLDLLPAGDMRLHLLDVSHPLLVASWNLALATFQGRHVDVLALHGDFHKLTLFEPLQAGSNARSRRRLYTFLGYTLANLDNEIRFFESLTACSAPGDLCLVDLQTAFATPDKPDEIKTKDPSLKGSPPRAYVEWMTGPIRRYGRGVRDVTLEYDLGTECVIPGSYEINLVANVELFTGQRKRFVVGRVKRYNPERLGEALRARGWSVESVRLYGGPTGKGAALMLLRRTG